MKPRVLGGFDLSLKAAAAMSVPTDWDGQWGRVESYLCGYSLPQKAGDLERITRCDTIAKALVMFARDRKITEAWIEGYGFSLRTQAHSLGELGGIVRLEFMRAGITLRTANMSSGRKLLLGRVPRSNAKEACRETLLAAGAPADWTLDESDAFVCANLGLSERGGYCFAQQVAA